MLGFSGNGGETWATGAPGSANEFRLDATLGAQAGDFNGDDVIDALDYSVWREAYAADPGGLESTHLGDNGDGMNGVDMGDFQLWLDNYGAGLFSAAPAIPEPTTATLLSLAWAALGALRRQWLPRRPLHG